ncbi:MULTISPECIES: hypothetical protein [unclassified Pseudoalteromonas]|uniref:hypothetical protein n=1 Tax=unclassified Pseudoalteromonas TaxID=194690 RepID=UPI0003F7A58B|nr:MULTISPECIES: hypothetical protein [unclassified Pseudoalteromonas]MBB1432077.1 hypothetical protein [Pseudoalteromonas sp. SG43-4]
MNVFIERLFDIIAIDIVHLSSYLSSSQQQYLDENLKSINDLDSDLYTDEEGENLEVLLHFLTCHKNEIIQLWNNRSSKDILVSLYTSSIISGSYDCFHFDLSKFNATYNPVGQKLTLYRVGRSGENTASLGNSWSKTHNGIKNYVQSSTIDGLNRPFFEAEVSDSEVLCEGNPQEDELILKRGFSPEKCRQLVENEQYDILQ